MFVIFVRYFMWSFMLFALFRYVQHLVMLVLVFRTYSMGSGNFTYFRIYLHRHRYYKLCNVLRALVIECHIKCLSFLLVVFDVNLLFKDGTISRQFYQYIVLWMHMSSVAFYVLYMFIMFHCLLCLSTISVPLMF